MKTSLNHSLLPQVANQRGANMAAIDNTAKKLTTASALIAHIALKTQALDLFGAQINVRQWSANERLRNLALIEAVKGEQDPLKQLQPQAVVVVLSLFDDAGSLLFPVKEWKDEQPVFEDETIVESFVQNRSEETTEAFVKISAFNGVVFGAATNTDEEEETVVKN